MARKTITAANSVFILTVAGFFPAGVKLEGYAADAAFTTDSVDTAETIMGVDGHMSAGYTPFITPQTITLQADSDSIRVFDIIANAQQARNEIIYLDALISLPSVKKQWVMTKGVLRNYMSIPSAQRVLQPRPFTIHWERVSSAVIV